MISSGFSMSSGQGVEKRAKHILDGLQNMGIKVSPLQAKKIKLPGLRHFEYLVGLPLAYLFKGSRFDLVDFQLPELSVGIGFIKCPKIVTVHDLIHVFSPEINPLLAKFYSRIIRTAVKEADVTICVSSQTSEDIEKLGWKYNEKVVIHNGIDPEFRPLPNKEGLKERFYGKKDKIVLGYLGGLGRRKRPLKLIQDFLSSDLSTDSVLVIWGRGPLEKKVEKLADGKRVIYKGFAPQDQIVSIYNSFDVFVFPSAYEGFGIPILEALACGVPTFIYRDAKIPREVARYAEKIDGVDEIKIRKVLRSRIREVKQKFSWKKTVDKVLKVYSSLISL